MKTAVTVKDSEVKDAKTVAVLTSTVKTAEKTKTTIPECPSGNLTDIKAMTKEIDGLATAYSRTVSEVKGKAEAVNGSKLDKIVADATKILNDSKGRVKDDKTRTVLENAIKTKDEKAISDAVKAVNDSIKRSQTRTRRPRPKRRSRRPKTPPKRRATIVVPRVTRAVATPDTRAADTRNPRAADTRTLLSSPQVVRPAAAIRQHHSHNHSSLPRAVATEVVPREGTTDMKICVSHIPLTVRPQSRSPAVNLSFSGARVTHPMKIGCVTLVFMGLSFRLVSLVGAECGE